MGYYHAILIWVLTGVANLTASLYLGLGYKLLSQVGNRGALLNIHGAFHPG